MKRIYHFYLTCMTLTLTMPMMIVSAFAVDDMWTVANKIIVDVYGKIVGVSTVLAGLMSAVAVIGAKLSNNQHKVDQAWDWLKRIWIAWAIINGIGAFIAYVEQMQRYAEKEDNEACREMIEDNIQEIGNGIASDAMRHRFFLVFQYEASMRAKRNTVDSIIQRLNEEADTARRYLDVCELEVLEPRYSDNFVLKLLYEILSKKTSQRVRLPDGVFDMTTAVHGIYEE